MAEHNETGAIGEEMAIVFLKKNGYAILETNWTYQHLEADIIALNNNTLIVAEVKTRKGNYFGEPEVFVNKQKQKNLIKLANEYVQRFNLNYDVRFDIIAITITNDGEKINHIKDAFLFGH